MANKNDKKRRIISFISEFFSRIQGLFLKLWTSGHKWVKSLWEAIKKDPLAFLTVVLVLANLTFVYFNWQSNQRAEKLFVGQSKPLIDVTPISISPGKSKADNS